MILTHPLIYQKFPNASLLQSVFLLEVGLGCTPQTTCHPSWSLSVLRKLDENHAFVFKIKNQWQIFLSPCLLPLSLIFP